MTTTSSLRTGPIADAPSAGPATPSRATRRWHVHAGLLGVPLTKGPNMRSPSRSMSLAIALILGSVGTAAAHAHLQTATPAAGSTVAAAPTELRLGFSEGVNVKFTGLVVTGPAGAVVPTGSAVLAPGNDRILLVPISGPLAPGAYRVDWHALATDGHKTDGSYGFTVKP